MTPTKILSLFLSFCLILEQSVFAQTIDLSHYFVRNSSQTIPQSDKFRPLHLRYISYDNQANDFKILLDKGDFFNQQTPQLPNSSTPKLEEATQELMKYFFIGLALPNEKFWVNLRPDSPDNILDPDLDKTDIGRIFLEADLQLKKDTSGMTSPQTKEGKEYWDKLYKKAGELFGSENITIPTLTRPWIVPDEVIIRESPEGAYIYKATLKVMLEEDYLTSRGGSRTAPTYQQSAFSDPRLKELNEYSTQLIKESIIPKLTKEINSARRYAPLRQVYYSLILAQWFKQKYGSLGSARASVNNYIDLIDSGNLANLTSSQPYDKQDYFQQYQKSFQDGEYNLQEPVYTPMGQNIRRYVSGGIKTLLYDLGEKTVVFIVPRLESMVSESPLIVFSALSPDADIKTVEEILKNIYPGGEDSMAGWVNRATKYKLENELKKGELTEEALKESLNKTYSSFLYQIKDARDPNEEEVRVISEANNMVKEFCGKYNLPYKDFSSSIKFVSQYDVNTLWRSRYIFIVESLTKDKMLKTIIHEAFHFISPGGFPFQWLDEGMTEYLTCKTLREFGKKTNTPLNQLSKFHFPFSEYQKHIPVAEWGNSENNGPYKYFPIAAAVEYIVSRLEKEVAEKLIAEYFKNNAFSNPELFLEHFNQKEINEAMEFIERLWIEFVLFVKNSFSGVEFYEKSYLLLKSVDSKIFKFDTPRNVSQKRVSVDNSGGSSSPIGGIDFRSLPIVIQAATNLGAGTLFSSLSHLRSMNIVKEWQEIEGLVNLEIVPSAERILEYLQASSCLKSDLSEDRQKVILLIQSILRIEEDEGGKTTDSLLIDILVVLNALSQTNDLKKVFLSKNTTSGLPLL